ncbi:hypothetical protein RCH06_002567 [Polaromonas sp. CG_9.5]|uniref:hypothetical protein n=1 Tax=Polaromonas sp. CG_9.5 TaxID=3071705 RepID=UPI002E081776|nr:hypothetical protein [Polaromonas sp. CG_9.5]
MIYKVLKPVALCCTVALLAGCAMSPIPTAENFQLTTQKKVRSAGHWSLLSRDVIEQMLASLERSGATRENAIHVAMPAGPSDFDRAFHEFLITELVQRNWQVLTSANSSALTLSYQTQIVRHNSQRPHFVPGLFTAITAGLYVLHNASPAGAALAVAGGLDVGASVSSGGPTHTELVLTTTVTGAGRYVSRKTDVYYVEESDTSLFASLKADPSAINVMTMKVVAQ